MPTTNLEVRRAINRLSQAIRTRSPRAGARLGYRTEQLSTPAGPVWIVTIFRGARRVMRSNPYPDQASLYDAAAAWVRQRWIAPPGAPRGNTNASDWPKKRAARHAAEYASAAA